jgi:hypothetical protein
VAPPRGLEAGKSLLAGFEGIAFTDGYGVYDALEKRTPGLRLAPCWAHIRRKFIDRESAFPKKTEQIVALIPERYAIEARTTTAPSARSAAPFSVAKSLRLALTPWHRSRRGRSR